MNEKVLCRLKFAILCTDSKIFPAWQANCITELLNYEHTDLVLILEAAKKIKTKPKTSFTQQLKKIRYLLWTLYYKCLVLPKLNSQVKIDLSSRLRNIETKKINFNKTKNTVYLNNDDLTTLKAKNLDFILHLEGSILKGDILNAANYGVWSFHHGDPDYYRGIIPAFWETYDKSSCIGVVLQRLTETLDGGHILHKGYFACSAFCFTGTYRKNLDKIFLGGIHFPKRVCQEILQTNDCPDYPHAKKNNVIKTKPNNMVMINYFLRLTSRILSNLVGHPKLSISDWKIAIVEKPIESFVHDPIDEHSIKYIHCETKNYFMADPFGVYFPENNSGLILFENFNQKHEQGKISSLKWSEAKTSSGENNILDIPGHLSYPYIFAEKDQFYCIPESSASHQVSLWQLSNNKKEWLKQATLIKDFPAVDPTVFYYNDYWWLFCTHADIGDNTHLFIWYAKELEGPWQQHALNPVKCDIRNSRPAGTPFSVDGIIYRPAQNCAINYGGSIMINRINALSPTSFQEELCHEIKAPPGKQGLHTLAKFGNNAVLIDIFSGPVFSFRKLKLFTTRQK